MTTNNPKISFTGVPANVASPLYKTILLVGQSNTATAGIYKDLELDTIADIETKFGSGQHLTEMLKESISVVSNSFRKPKIIAVSYQDDNSGDVAKVLKLSVTGTATETKFLKLKINSLNQDKVASRIATIMGSRLTQGANLLGYSKNPTIISGSPKNAKLGFHPILKGIYSNDCIVEVEITKGMTQNQIATAISNAITSKTSSVFSSAVNGTNANEVDLTAKNKGIVSQGYTIELVNNTLSSGVSVAITQTTEGSGTIDISNILNITDSNGIKLSSLNFEFVVVPYSFTISNLVSDAYSKIENVLQTNNVCLDYLIIQATAIDTSSNTEINNLASANPTSEEGRVRALFVLNKVKNWQNYFVINYDEKNKLENKQFSYIQSEVDGSSTTGITKTLSNQDSYKDINKVLSYSVVREAIVELFVPRDFTGEEDYNENGISGTTSYNKADIIRIFTLYRDILDGSSLDDIYADNFSGLLKNDEKSKNDFDELLENSISFDSSTGTLSQQIVTNFVDVIKNLNIISYNS